MKLWQEGVDMLRYSIDKEQDMSKVCELWQQAFRDSQKFMEYYCSHSYRQNEIVMDEDEAGILQAMLHLNPYQMVYGIGEEERLHYIVGVATDSACRRQGKMRLIMENTLRKLASEGETFTYLMPARQCYYEPFNFVLVQEKQEILYKTACSLCPEVDVREIEYTGLEFVGNVAKKILKKKYKLYPERTLLYMQQLYDEVHTEQGEICALYKEECMGYYAYVVDVQQHKLQVNQVVADIDWEEAIVAISQYAKKRYPGYTVAITRQPDIMLRILCPVAFLKRMRPKRSIDLWVQLVDDILPGNTGIYHWVADTEQSYVERKVAIAEGIHCVTMDMTQFTELVITLSLDKSEIFITEIV